MPVSKFRFVSPGVQTAEIDNSQLPKLPNPIGPVIIGKALRGPLMRPVRISSFSDFVDVFGEPVPGGAGGDIWRDGNRLTPTYGAYAAQAYLKNASPVTYVRLGGFENDNSLAGGEAGWAVDNANGAYGLFAATALSGATGWKVTGSAALAAIIYTSGAAGLVGTNMASLSGDSVVNADQTWVRVDGSQLETRIVLNGVTSSVNLNPSSKKYIRNILNTNPTAYSDKKYFLGETFRTWVLEKGVPLTNDKNNVTSSAVILLKLANYQSFKKQAVAANDLVEDNNVGWVVSQHLGVNTSFTPDISGAYDVQKLFRVVGLTEGEWNSQNLKISIEDIKGPLNEYVKYGTFTLSLRKASDSDVRPEYVERFTGLSLDPSSESYVAKRIGDKYTVWDYTKRAYSERGTFDNNSKFIRVEMDTDVDNAKTNPSLLPFGFYGRKMYENVAASGSSVALSGDLLTGNTAVAATQFTASFEMPRLPLLDSTANTPVTSFNGIYWGVKTTQDATRKLNPDYAEYVRTNPSTFTATKTQFLFSLDDVSASLNTGTSPVTINDSLAAGWKETNRSTGVSVTAQVSGGIDVLLKKFDRFTMPLVGGFDGLDITKRDPFANSILNVNGATEFNSYAYNSVKVAVESISDPEVVEMNLATMPGVNNTTLNNQLIEKCELRGDSLAIVDLLGDYDPEGATAEDKKPDIDQVIDQTIPNYSNSSYGCAFFPWVLIRDTISNARVWVPSSVVALGTFASSEKKTELWFAPAGFNRGGLTDGAAGLPVLQTAMRLTSKDRDALYEKNINPIASFPAEGIVIFGQKTLQVTPSALDRINVRRLMIYLKKEISRMAATVLFDPNIKVTWKRFTDQAVPFLASVQSRFGLSDYRVILDETTTTPDLVDRNIVYAKILLKPTRAIEFIALDFVITNTGASFAD